MMVGFNGIAGDIFGVKITPSLAATTAEPRRIHKKSRAMSDSYHNRVQKKWVKRFGMIQKPAAFKTPYGIIAHPSVIQALQQHAKHQN